MSRGRGQLPTVARAVEPGYRVLRKEVLSGAPILGRSVELHLKRGVQMVLAAT